MRLIRQNQRLILNHRPFAGGLGASLYVGVVDSANDPGPPSIVYRRNVLLRGTRALVAKNQIYQIGNSSLPKTAALARVTSPTHQIAVDIPATWHGKTVWCQIRTFAGNVEHESIYRPRKIVIDNSGNDVTVILGSANLTAIQARDGGGVAIQFTFTPVRDGIQPLLFRLLRTAGPTSPTSVTVAYSPDTRIYTLTFNSLQDAGHYTFTLRAENGTHTRDLVTGISFTADGAGPPAVSNLVATEY